MITKTTTPIVENTAGRVIGTKVEYRLFGILLYKKVLLTPLKYGIVDYEYHTSI